MSLLSELSRGYGSWTAGYVDPYYKNSRVREPTLPEIDAESHCHGVTVSTKSGRSTAMSMASKRTREHTDDSLYVPKTYTTRRGALQLFVAPDDIEDDDEEAEEEDGYKLRPKYVEIHRPMGQELIDLSLKLGTLEKLASSVLQFGDKEAGSEDDAISQEKNKAFLKFLHQIDGRRARAAEHSLRPGEDLNTYLRDLRSSSSMRYHNEGSTYIPKSRESQELQAILRGLDHQGWPMAFQQDGGSDRLSSTGQFTRPVSRVSSRGPSPGPPSTPRSSYQVLSSRKLAASLKSLNYLGRPSSRLSVDDEAVSDIPQPAPISNITMKGWSPTESTDEEILAMRTSGLWGSMNGSSIGDESEMDELKKRRLMRLKEKTHLTYSDTLYQGRNAQKGDSQHKVEVKVEVFHDGKGHSMSQIDEELGGSHIEPSEDVDEVEEDATSGMWAENVARAQKQVSTAKGNSQRPGSLRASSASTRSTPSSKDRRPLSSRSSKSTVDQLHVKEVTFVEPGRDQAKKVSMDDKVFLPKRRPASGGSLPSSRTYPKFAGKRRMSIVTVQNLSEVSQEHEHPKTFTATKCKPFVSYDYEKTKNAILGHRHQSANQLDTRPNISDVDQTGFNLTPRPSYPGSSFGKGSWSSNFDLAADEGGLDEPTELDIPNEVTDGSRGPLPTPEDHMYYADLAAEHVNQIDSESDTNTEDNEQVEQDEPEEDAESLKEEDILDNIQECDAEIGEIEDKYEARSVVSSDSGTYNDQALTESVEENLDDLSADLEKVDTEEEQQVVEDIVRAESNESKEPEVTEEPVEEVIADVDVEDIGDGLDVAVVEEGSLIHDEIIETPVPVDEALDEDASTVYSHHSALKGRSKFSVVSESEDGVMVADRQSDISQGRGSGTEEQGEVPADLSPPPDEDQTQFSGSTASYVDVLAHSETNSRPVSAKHSQPVSEDSKTNSPVSRSGSGLVGTSRPGSGNSLGGSEKNNLQTSRRSSGASASALETDLTQPLVPETSSETQQVVENSEKSSANSDAGDQAEEELLEDNAEEDPAEIDVPADDNLKEEIEVEIDVMETDKESYKESLADDTSVSGVEQPGISKMEQIVIKPAVQFEIEEVPEVAQSDLPVPETERKASIMTKEKLQMQDIIDQAKSKQTERRANAARKPEVLARKPEVPAKKPEVQTIKKKSEESKGIDKERKKSIPDIAKPQPESYNPFRNQKAAQKQQRTAQLLGKNDRKKSDPNNKVDEAVRVDGDSLSGGVRVDDPGDGGFEVNAQDAHSIAAELEHLGLGTGSTGSKKKGKKDKAPGGMQYPLLPPGKRPKAPPEKMKLPDHLKDALKRRPSLSFESLEKDLERLTDIVGESLSGPTLEAVGEGLTEEELDLAKIILQKKLDDARNKMDGKETPTKKKVTTAKSGKKSGGKKKKGAGDDIRTAEEIERDAIREKHAEAKQKRDEEAAELQRKIAERKALLQSQEDQASAKSKEIREKMEALEREAEDLQRAEDEARDILADVRKKQREERDARRKADLERKKQEAADRRERERREMEEKRQKELDMMEKIADAEMRRRLREEEERRADEEERLAQERYEEEMRENTRLEEEAEERMKEMERQAEEEAMQRLIFEREEAERQRRRLRDEEEIMREEERLKREQMEAESRRLEEEQMKIMEAENARRDRERNRLMELQRMEDEVRQKMQEELEAKKQEAMSRRDFNLNNRMNVDKLRHNQGITRAWTFSYFVRWPRDTYESALGPDIFKRRRPMGAGDPRKAKIKNPRPKQVVEAPPEMEGGPAAPDVGIPKP